MERVVSLDLNKIGSSDLFLVLDLCLAGEEIPICLMRGIQGYRLKLEFPDEFLRFEQLQDQTLSLIHI